MKGLVSVLLALLVTVLCLASAETDFAEPWVPTTAQGMMDALGLQLGLPDGATGVTWQMLEERQMGQVRFSWQGKSCTAHIALADAFEDISGLACEWETQQACAVGRCEGVSCRSRDGIDAVDLCLWYDENTGVMYSLSVTDAEPDGFDILAAARVLYIPLQTE